MIKRRLRNFAAASILAGATHAAVAQTSMPQTPITKILAVGTFDPGTDMSQVQRILPAQVRETAQLYLDGKIDQWYSLEDRPGVVFILNMTDTQAAHAMLEELPLGKAHLMTFELTPIGPLNPLRHMPHRAERAVRAGGGSVKRPDRRPRTLTNETAVCMVPSHLTRPPGTFYMSWADSAGTTAGRPGNRRDRRLRWLGVDKVAHSVHTCTTEDGVRRCDSARTVTPSSRHCRRDGGCDEGRSGR
ncbi:MAG: hypothetical protein JO366_15200 [Methylobacteriaceae bacterium]|nr:hypothetical protein [Methylobacteriaceae bacterium]MBV9246151.1 hypothetical protein [Methylobacteriaceae bacterium]